MEFVVTQVKGGVDWFEGLEVNIDLSFFPFGGDNFAAVDDKTIGGNFIVELQTLLRGCDG